LAHGKKLVLDHEACPRESGGQWKQGSKQTRRNLDIKPFKAKTAPGFFDVELRMPGAN